MHRHDVCDVYCYDDEKVERVQRRLRDEPIAEIVPFLRRLPMKTGRRSCMRFAVKRSCASVT